MTSLGRAFARFAGFVSAATALTVFLATGTPSWADDPHFHAAPASVREQRIPHTDENAIRVGQTSFAKNCAACHGADARGNFATNAPRLQGASDWYLARQLRNFRNGVRGTHPQDVYGEQMALIAGMFTDDADISDMVAYLNTR